MSQLDDLGGSATANPVASPPSMAELRKRVRRRTRNTIVSFFAAGLVIAGVTFGIVTASSSSSSSRSIIATPGPDDAVTTTTVVPSTVAHLVPSDAETVSQVLVRSGDGGGEILFEQNGCSYSLRYAPQSSLTEYFGAPITVRGVPGKVLGMGNIAWNADGTGYGLNIEAQDVKPVAEQCDPQPVAESLLPIDADAWGAFVANLGDRVTVRSPHYGKCFNGLKGPGSHGPNGEVVNGSPIGTVAVLDHATSLVVEMLIVQYCGEQDAALTAAGITAFQDPPTGSAFEVFNGHVKLVLRDGTTFG